MTWYFNNEPLDNPPEGYMGFVYEIRNLLTGKLYIGKKFLTRAATKQIKGKKKKIRKESDWRNYYGSNELLLEDVDKLGKENFRRTILVFCETKSLCGYYETKEILMRDALLNPKYYNQWLSAKITRKHLLKFQLKDDMISGHG